MSPFSEEKIIRSVVKVALHRHEFTNPQNCAMSVGMLLIAINPPTFGTFFIQDNAPFETIRYCGFEITVYSVDSRNGFEW